MADATEVSYPEIASNIADNYDQIIAAANSLNSDSSLASDLPFEPQAARVVGVFVGAAPDNGFVGIESQTLVLYDTVTGEFGEYYYLGGLCQVVPAQTQLGANVAIQAANSAA